MAIITKPAGGVLKGVPATFTLNKAELLSVSAVSSDAYFSNSANWNRVHLIYKSSQGKQYEVVEFNATLSSPTGTFSVSEKARDAFEIQTLEILDFDGGIFVVPRSSLTVADFDISFTSTPPVFTGTYIDWTERSGYTPEADGGITSTLTEPDTSTASLIYGDNTTKNIATAPFSLVYKLNKEEFLTVDQRFLGITDAGKATYTGFYKDSPTPTYITFIAENQPAGAMPIDAFSDPAITVLFLKITISENKVEYFVNNVKITEFVQIGLFLSAGEMIPAARVYDGMEVLETYFE